MKQYCKECNKDFKNGLHKTNKQTKKSYKKAKDST